jgi:hypothetical protein
MTRTHDASRSHFAHSPSLAIRFRRINIPQKNFRKNLTAFEWLGEGSTGDTKAMKLVTSKAHKKRKGERQQR